MDYSEDIRLSIGIRNGSRAMFEAAFRKYYVPLCAYAGNIVDKADVEDIVQDTMFQLWERRGSLATDGRLASYLFVSVRNRCLNLLSRKEIGVRVLEALKNESDVASDACPLSLYSAKELSMQIQKALDAMPDQYREAFLLNRFAGMSYKEIAQMLDISSKTVDYRISRAVSILKSTLKDFAFLPPFLGILA